MAGGEVTWHGHLVSRAQREARAGHKGCVVWFTGLSGSGKSTIANLVDRTLHERGARSFVLDGDNVRHDLTASPTLLRERHGDELAARFGLGFSPVDRAENIRRVGAVARLFAEAGLITLCAFVSPYRRDRDAVRASLSAEDFLEVYVDTPLGDCEERDPKGLYRRARAGELTGMTGIDAPYEAPTKPELMLPGGREDPEALAARVIALLEDRSILGA